MIKDQVEAYIPLPDGRSTPVTMTGGNESIHWAFAYIGRPWVSGAQGPDSFDCWGFFRFIQKVHFGRDIAQHDVNADDYKLVVNAIKGDVEKRLNWEQTLVPKHGDAVLMAHSKYPSHVGLWLDVDGGGVLHCVRGEGVVFSGISSLKTCGWGRVEFYSYVSNA